jgi:large subunit ribosomal protein L10
LSLNLDDKKAIVSEVASEVAKAQTMVVAEYRGIQVGALTKLRADARKQGVYLRVLKNTLARRAVADTSFAQLADHMVGPLIYSLSEDPIAAAKVLHTFAKENNSIVIKAGAYEGKVMNAQEVGVLASIPSRDELLAKLMGTMQATISSFVRGLAAVRDQKEAAAA